MMIINLVNLDAGTGGDNYGVIAVNFRNSWDGSGVDARRSGLLKTVLF